MNFDTFLIRIMDSIKKNLIANEFQTYTISYASTRL